jgi:hypothetical protein
LALCPTPKFIRSNRTSRDFHFFQDLDSSSDDEDFQSNRKQFQQARSISTASKKSISFFDMELTNKDENLRQSVPFVRQITEDGKAKLEIYRPTTNPIYIYTQVSDQRQPKGALITTRVLAM